MVTTIDTAGARRIEEAAPEVVQTLLGTSYADLVELARAQGFNGFYGSIYVQVHAARTHAGRPQRDAIEVSMTAHDAPDPLRAVYLDLSTGEEACVIELMTEAIRIVYRDERCGHFNLEEFDRRQQWCRDLLDDELTRETATYKAKRDAVSEAIGGLAQAPSSAGRSALLAQLVAERVAAERMWGDLLNEMERRKDESAHDRMARSERRAAKERSRPTPPDPHGRWAGQVWFEPAAPDRPGAHRGTLPRRRRDAARCPSRAERDRRDRRGLGGCPTPSRVRV